MSGSTSVTPAGSNSSTIVRLKSSEPGVPMYGCEHLQTLLTQSLAITTQTIQHYKAVLRAIFDQPITVRQTCSKSLVNEPFVALTATYLCLQCIAIVSRGDRTQHALQHRHQFFVESRGGSLHCDICEDLVFDPTLEDLRLRKKDTGSFSSRRKRHDGLFIDIVEEDHMSSALAASCQTNGLRGIYNMGATCFMSVILQSFIMNPVLRKHYLNDGHPPSTCLIENCISCCMDELYQNFYIKDGVDGYAAANILAASWSMQDAAFSGLVGNEEQDAHEYFQFLVEALHKTAKNILPSTEGDDRTESQKLKSAADCDCIVHRTFYGKSQSVVTCQKCFNETSSVEPFLDLSLGLDAIVKKGTNGTKRDRNGDPLASKTAPLTLQRCLDEEYKLPERCEYTCRKCESRQDARKQLSIKRLPNVLCLQFKRFEHDMMANSTSKIDIKVEFPLQINMFPYTDRAKRQETSNDIDWGRACTYDLLSVVVHTGSKINTGHYISYSRVGEQWFLFDDHKITLASESQVLAAEAFILFYIGRSVAS